MIAMSGRRWLLIFAMFWLGISVLVPGLIVLRMSLSDAADALPPYMPQFTGLNTLGDFLRGLDFETYRLVLTDSLYFESYLTSVRLALSATFLAFLVGYPIALAISRTRENLRPVLLMAVIIPFWTSFLIRIYAWIGLLKDDGLINAALRMLGLIDTPLALMNNETGVLIGLVYAYLPFMVLPVYAALEKLDPSLVEAAADLGCPPWRRFFQVTLPLTLPGVMAGAALVFIPAVGEFVIPDLLGGSDTLMIGRTLWIDFFSNRDWPQAAAAAVVMLATILLPFILLRHFSARGQAA